MALLGMTGEIARVQLFPARRVSAYLFEKLAARRARTLRLRSAVYHWRACWKTRSRQGVVRGRARSTSGIDSQRPRPS